MKSFIIKVLENLTYEWSKGKYSITMHNTNDQLYINASKEEKQIKLVGHSKMMELLKQYPLLNKLISHYKISFSYIEGNFVGEIYYMELSKNGNYHKYILKKKSAKKIQTLLTSLENSLQEDLKKVENSLKIQKQNFLEIYSNFGNLEANYIDKSTNFWSRQGFFINNFEKLFPNIMEVMNKKNNLYLNYIEKNQIYEIAIKSVNIAGNNLLEVLNSLENYLKQEKEFKLNLKRK